MNCDRVREDIKAYIDGELGWFARQRVASHLETCDECRMEAEAMTDLTNEVQNVQQVPSPSSLREKVMGRIEFEPDEATAPPRRSWVFSPAGAAVVLLFVVVGWAMISPVFMQARRSASFESVRSPLEEGSGGMSDTFGEAPQAAAQAPVSSSAAADHKASDPLESAPMPKQAFPAPQLMIIKTAELTVQVKRFQPAYDQAIAIAKSAGGYVTDSTATTQGTAPTEGSATLRVPVGSFERVIESVSRLGVVKAKNLNGEDVTGESVDLQSRLRNKRAEERQYLEIMNRARRIVDIVTVTNELSRVRGEIEEAEGRLKYLKSASAMATINLTLTEKAKPKPAPQSSLKTSFTDAGSSLVGALNGLASLAIWLVVFSPFWAIPLGAFVLARRRVVAAE